MYKVFVNDIKLILTDNSNDYEQFVGDKIRFESKKILRSWVTDLPIEGDDVKLIYHYDIDELLYFFRRIFKFVKAAGGLVRNTNGEYLFIFRKGKWDIPKGKMDKSEVPIETALREVEEECAVNGLSIEKKLIDTYHTYTYNGKRVLKKTYWYLMDTNFEGELVPQLEEDITDVRWINVNEFDMIRENTFRGILEVLEAFELNLRNFQ